MGRIEDFTSFIQNNLFHKAVGIILNQLPDNGSNVANDGVDELKHHAELVSRKLSNFTVVFVDKIKSKFKMKFNVGKTLRRGTDVTRIGQQDDSSFYIDRKESKIVLALNKVKSNSIRVEQILSMAINENQWHSMPINGNHCGQIQVAIGNCNMSTTLPKNNGA